MDIPMFSLLKCCWLARKRLPESDIPAELVAVYGPDISADISPTSLLTSTPFSSSTTIGSLPLSCSTRLTRTLPLPILCPTLT